MKREIKFRFWDATNQIMSTDSDGWNENVGINTMFKELVERYNVIPMQYTGLKDDNGKEIWEGDIVEYYKGYLTQVFFHAGSFMINISDSQYIELSQTSAGYPVVGNIYENPEMKVKKNLYSND